MEQVAFIVWRESLEAMLVIGILSAWLKRNPVAAQGRPYLWAGVLLGLLLAGLLAWGLFSASTLFSDHQDVFQLVMVMAAAALIVHMVYWMRRHGRTLKQDIETGLARHTARGNGWGVLMLAACAVAREGSETVVFLYGALASAEPSALWPLLGAGLAGFCLALALYHILQLGVAWVSWRLFFRATGAMLLLLAAGLFTSGVERMISLDWLPALLDPVWDSSALLDDSSAMGSVVSAFTGYRAQPALMSLLGFCAYWLSIGWLLRTSHQAKVPA